MLKIFHKTIILLVFCSFFVFPVLVFADEQTEQQKIDLLGKQVEALIVEITRLQNIIISVLENKIEAITILSEFGINDVISNGVEWFKSAQEENGHFKYEYLPYENEYLNTDNIVRQTGALYLLGEVAVRDSENIHDLGDTIKQAISYFEDLSVVGKYNGKTFRCIVSKKGGNKCKLGSVSLALVGVLDFVTRYPAFKDTYTPLINDYANYILSMKMENKGFRNNFYTEKNTQTEDESSYGNGEAMLALVRYYKFNPTVEVKEIIDETFSYIESEEVIFDSALYLWAMAAIKDMYDMWPKEKYLEYVKQYTDWRINGFRRYKNTSHNVCAYIEGVVSAYSVLESNVSQEEQDYYMEEIDFWLNKSSKLQIKENDIYRGVYENGKKVFVKLENLNQAVGGFLTGKNELTQRIDFTQHCVSSYLQKLVDIEGKMLK